MLARLRLTETGDPLMSKNSNALLHGVYSRDIILPGERPEDFNALLNGMRLYFVPRGTPQDAIVFDIAVLHWRKRRINPLLQFEFVDAQFAREVEKSGKGRVEKGREKVNYTAAVVQLSEAVASLADELKKNKSLGKIGANIRSLLGDIEKLRPTIAAVAESVDEAKKIDGAFKRFQRACELDARLDAQIAKKIQSLVMVKEFQRQFGQDSNVKLLPHHPPTAHGTATKASSKKSTDANENWNDDDDNDNDNDNEIDPNEYDWPHEYDQALAEQKKARRGHRTQND
jgi:hypothetical protein